MLATTFTCPECRAVLKTGGALPPGSKIKCPKCATVFALPDDTLLAPPSQASGATPAPGPRDVLPLHSPGREDPEAPASGRRVGRQPVPEESPDRGEDYHPRPASRRTPA